MKITSMLPQKKMMAITVPDAIDEGQQDGIGGPGLQFTVPGAFIVQAQGLMRGHGTYLDNDELKSSLAGTISQTNKLLRVKPLKYRYNGEIGDVVVGRIVEVQQRRWRVDTGSRVHSVLMLTSVNLPGGELRRKSIEDELQMREYLKEGDLVSAEVQQCFHDGALSLHTRNLKYGKLGQGQLVTVPAYLIRRRKSHFHNLPFGVSVILGCNGFIWVTRPNTGEEDGQTGGYAEDIEPFSIEIRNIIVRVVNCIRLLARNSIALMDTTIINAFYASVQYNIKQLNESGVADEVANEVVLQSLAEDIHLENKMES